MASVFKRQLFRPSASPAGRPHALTCWRALWVFLLRFDVQRVVSRGEIWGRLSLCRVLPNSRTFFNLMFYKPNLSFYYRVYLSHPYSRDRPGTQCFPKLSDQRTHFGCSSMYCGTRVCVIIIRTEKFFFSIVKEIIRMPLFV